MKVIFFTKGDRRLPSARTRAYLVCDYLKASGHESEIYQIHTRPWWNISTARFTEFIRNISILQAFGKDDLVFLQRTVHQLDFLVMVVIRKIVTGRGYAFDFDDAIFLENGHGNLKARIIIRYADVVFAGSQFLKDYGLRFNKNTYLFTTALDTEHIFTPRINTAEHKDIVIGWTGTPSHYDNMKLVVPAITRLVQEGYPISLFLLGGGPRIQELFHSISGLKLTALPFLPSDTLWTRPREIAAYLREFDIGLYPLQKTEWNKGKDLHKGKEYMACGVAIIVSNWGENPLLIKDGVEGLLVEEDGWYIALKKLITEPAYRKELARRGRAWADHECSFRVHVPRMLKLMKQHAI